MKSVFTFVCYSTLILWLTSCKKNRELYVPAAELYEQRLQVGVATATVQAGFSGLEITERGICWSTNDMPNTGGPHKSAGSGDGNITVTIDGLSPNTTYYVRAYAINKGGTGYSEPFSFIVQDPPDISTSPAFARSTNSAMITTGVGYFNAMSSGTYGVCYATHRGPTTSDLVSAKVPYQGNSFGTKLTGLSPGTVYYARSFVELSGGIFYGNEISFNTYAGTVSDIEGNSYFTVKIGTQEWMVQNLRTTRYQDGVPIPAVSADMWSSHPGDARAVYYDNESYASIYGRYYNRDAMTSLHGLAPAGWRIPSYQDWQQLFSYVGVDSAAIRLISTEWTGSGADNRWGLSVMPAGMRLTDGTDDPPTHNAYFWTSTYEVGYQQGVVFGGTYFDYLPYNVTAKVGLSVRCIRN